jgi:K+-sensing histidine kinase KdpD
MGTSHEKGDNLSNSSAKEYASLLVPAWTAVQRWFVTNTFAPAWLNSRWHYPMVNYLVAVLLQGIVIVVMKVLLQTGIPLSVSALFMIVVVVLVVGICGAGPGLFATVSGTILLDHFSGPFLFPLLPSKPPDVLAVVLLLIVGLSISRLATRTETACRRTEALNVVLHTSEQEERAHSRELEATFEAMSDAVFVHDTQEQLRRTNRAAHAIFDLERQPNAPSHSGEEHAALLLFRDEHGQPLSEEHWPLRRILSGEVHAGATTVDVLFHSRSGREMQYNTSGAPIHDEQQHIIGTVLAMRDVTARRQVEQRTQEALKALLLMAESLVLVPEEKGQSEGGAFPMAREVAQRMATLACTVLGCKRASIVTLEPLTPQVQSLAVIGLSGEQEQQWWTDTLTSYLREHLGDPRLASWLQADGVLILAVPSSVLCDRLKPYDVGTILSVPMYLGKQLVGILSLDYGSEEHLYTLQDMALAGAVTKLVAIVLERESLLQERADARASKRALQETNRQMNEFISITGHELRTPLTVIMGTLEIVALVTQKVVSPQEAQFEEMASKLDLFTMLARAQYQVNLLARLVNDLVDVSSFQADMLEIHLEVCDLAVIVSESVKVQRQIVPTRTISMPIISAEMVLVRADAQRVGQVVTNYVTNALKYSAADKSVEVRLQVEGQRVRVLVRDQGPGLSASQQVRIWERFHRVPGIKVQSGSSVGLGLGLHISWTIIERHQGQVGVESSPGMGSTFWFTLPLACPEAEAL